MGKYFALLLGAAILMILTASGGSYWLTSAVIKQADHEATVAAVNGVASGLTAYLQTIGAVMDKMGQDPRLIAAIQSGDGVQTKSVVTQFEPLLPGNMRLRLVLPGNIMPDESSTPKMGYADVDLSRETFNENQPPMVQGEGADRHLAIARGVKSGQQTIAVLLASLNYDFFKIAMTSKNDRQPYIELQQDGVVLSAVGDASYKQAADEGAVVKIPETAWILKYWPPADLAFGDSGKLLAAITLPILLTGLIFLFAYKRFAHILREDQHNIVRFIKDLIVGKTHSNYPVHIDELRLIISSVMQFKRIIDSENLAAGAAPQDFSPDNDGLFSGESLDVNSFFKTEALAATAPASRDSNAPPAATAGERIRLPLEELLATPNPVISAPAVLENPTLDPPVFALGQSGTSDTHGGVETIFRAYDIRGPVGEILSKETGYDLGRSIGSEAKECGCEVVVVGRDGRNSSQGLCDAVCKGLLSTGVNVLDIGIVPTPVLYFVAQHHPGQSGVMITGSHHGPEYNGLKMVINGEYLADERIMDLKRRIEVMDFRSGTPGSKDSNALFVNEYIGMISEDVHLGRPMKIVVDCANGAAGSLAPVLLKTLGCEVIELFCDIDGDFPNHAPDPSVPENLTDLIAAVRHYQAEVGIAFDGDGDRLAVVDSSGKIIYPDRQMMLYAKDVLAANRGAEIVFDVKCTHHLPERIKKFGGRPLMWKTGRPYIRSKLKETGAKLGGEMSGSIFFNDRWFGFDDALYTAARLIEILSADSRPSAEVFADFPEWTATPELVIPMPEGQNVTFVEALQAAANFGDAQVSTIDGLRVDFPDGWGLIRASKSRAALIMRFEAENTRALVRIQTQFRQLVQQIAPGLRLPF